MKKGIIIVVGKIFLGVVLLQGYGLFGKTTFVYGARRMVEISVDAIEITETNLKKLGIEWADAFSFEEGSIPSILGDNALSSGMPYDIYKMGTVFRTTPFTSSLHALINNNEARFLANPKLVTYSGSKAHFLVGGEIPYVYTASDDIVIEWKEYGVSLDVEPVVIDNTNISASLNVGVVELGDWYNYGAFRLPSFTKREMTNKVMIKSGQTLVIAGLKKTSKIVSKRRVPLLGYIPLIGDAFFTYADTANIETSLVMFVTFKLVK